jgi:hypothetical protein
MLLEALRQGEYHVLHFIGHGDFDEATEDGVLLMEDDEGFTCRVSSRRIGQVLRDHDSLRLAIINACEGGRDAVDDPFSGIAGSMLQQGVPAVVAMQFEITDRAAILFSRDLYDALANGYPVDAAVAEARKAIWADGNDIEWATPVLFLRAEDGRLFNVHPKTSRLWSRVRPSRRHALGLVAALALVLALITGFLLYARDDGGAWPLAAPARPPRCSGGSVDGRLRRAAVAGGGVGAAEGRPKISRVDVYDPGTKAWRAGPELPVAPGPRQSRCHAEAALRAGRHLGDGVRGHGLPVGLADRSLAAGRPTPRPARRRSRRLRRWSHHLRRRRGCRWQGGRRRVGTAERSLAFARAAAAPAREAGSRL